MLIWFHVSAKVGILSFTSVIYGYRLILFLLLACINSEFWKVICVGKYCKPRFSSSWIRWAPLITIIFIILSLYCILLCELRWAMSEIVSGIYSGIVTRRPLVLQLHKTDEGQQEYAEFGHLPRRRFTDFGIYNDLRCFFFLWALV